MALQNGASTAPTLSPERGRTAAFRGLGAIRGIGIRLASPDQIRSRSSGEVTRAATIHYQSRKPEEGGLFCERIFGPSKDWTCSCGKYQRRRTPGFRCERCGVEIAPASVRRERLGHIELISPVVHPWFLSYQQPSIISLLLDLSPSTLAAILRAQVYLVLSVDEAQRERLCAQGHATSLPELLRSLKPGAILEEQDYRTLCSTFPGVCEVATGALALQQALKALDVEVLSRALQEASKQASEAERKRLYKRLDVVEAFRSSGVKPSWMVLSVIPVLPADLRPILELKSGRLASSDLNVLYERLLHRNQRIKQLQSVDAPRIILQHEQRLLQEAAEALIDNGHRARPWKGPQGQPLRSLTDILSGKGGRFRHNLLGKRVDYSGRSVICAGLDLRLHQCGLPKKIAIELFKPFIMRKLLLYNYATSLHTAKRMVERRHPLIFDVLEECLHERYVLLNRAPTLHRLGIQAFEAKLVEGDAIRLHPLVCSAFNADFDGDQMAVHLPLSEDAQDEAKSLLLSTRNLRSSADSSPAIVVSQEMVLGLYYLSQERPSEKSAYRRFASEEEALLALEHRVIDLHTPLQVRFASHTRIYETPHEAHCLADLAARQQGPGSQRHPLLTTTAGRLLINQVLPPELGYRNYAMTKDCLKLLVSECLARCGEDVTARVAEQLKNLGFRYATRSGISFAMSDMKNPGPIQERIETLKRTTAHQQKELDEQVRAGILSPLEREQQVITLWEQATAKISQVCQEGLDPWGSLSTITASGATKAKFQQIRQLNGIRGLLADPAGRIIPVPILSNYLEGMRSWEVFIAARGARKGFMNRSLDTAISGYLTRKLVECGQDVWITCEDCGGNETLSIPGAELQALEIGELRLRLLGRVLGRDLPQCCLQAGAILGEEDIASLMQAGVEAVNVRSPLTCQAPYGLCQQCYGWDLAKRQLVSRGTLVGVIAGQSIGEPGTQLTMRTFHSGGIAHAQGDITMGLPRVNELFEARLPHPCAPLALDAGTVHLLSSAVDAQRTLTLASAGRTCLPPEQGHRYHIPAGMPLLVRPSQWVERGTLLADGPLNLKELLHLQGKEAAARYLIREVQLVYRVAGVSIHDKHLEVIVRQLLRYGQVLTSTTPQWPLGSLVDTYQVQAWNLAHGASCTLRPQILGLSRAALQTPSWLGAASFQETARVLADAAIRARIDPLRGPKERIILGLPIPTPPPVVQRK